MSCIFLGIKNLNNIDDCLQTESKLAELIGIERGAFLKRTACREFLTSCTHWNVKQIDKINLDVLKEHSRFHKNTYLIVDIDQTTKSTEGIKIERAKPGFNTKRKGKPSLKYSISLVNNYIFSKKLDSGNTHCLTNFRNIYNDTIKKINQIPEISNKSIILRIDGGYFSKETLQLIKTEQVKFVTKCRINLVLIKNLIKTNSDKWHPLKENVSYLYFKDQKLYSD